MNEFNNSLALSAKPSILIEYGIEDNEYFNSEAEWINIEHCDESSATFSVKRNTWAGKRYATIRIKNKHFNDFTDIKVSQEWMGRKPIDIELSNVTTCSFDANITSDDDDIFVLVNCMSSSKNNTTEYYEYQCMVNAQMLAKSAMSLYVHEANKLGVDVIDMLREQNLGGNGNFTLHYDKCKANQRWVTYAVGVKLIEGEDGKYDVEAITPMDYAVAEIAYPTYRNDISFGVDVTVDSHFGSDVDIAVNPTNWDGDYYYLMANSYDLSQLWSYYNLSEPENLFTYFSDYWNDNYYSYIRDKGLTIEDAYEIYGIDRGASQKRYSLNAYTDYTLLTFALDNVDGILQIVSIPQVSKFSTQALVDSEIDFEYTINSLNPRRVNYTITPSLNDECYYSTVISKEEYETWDEALLHKRLVDEGTKNGVYIGTQDIEMVVLPETEYYILCVGVYGGVATTNEIVKFEFVTPAQQEPKCEITGINILGPYHVKTLYEYDPQKYSNLWDWSYFEAYNYCNVATEIYYDGEPKQIYSLFFADIEVEGLNTEQIIAKLRDFSSEAKGFFYVKKDVSLRYYAMVEDEDGNVDLYISPEEYYFTADDYLTSEEDIAHLAEIYDEVLALEDEASASTRASQPGALCINLR